jgi:hypothetical protein
MAAYSELIPVVLNMVDSTSTSRVRRVATRQLRYLISTTETPTTVASKKFTDLTPLTPGSMDPDTERATVAEYIYSSARIFDAQNTNPSRLLPRSFRQGCRL